MLIQRGALRIKIEVLYTIQNNRVLLKQIQEIITKESLELFR